METETNKTFQPITAELVTGSVSTSADPIRVLDCVPVQRHLNFIHRRTGTRFFSVNFRLKVETNLSQCLTPAKRRPRLQQQHSG
ncbi:hypothetical protein ILYODFUR_031815 [Ilyodon furcidens]|uniref:Uncharacterized protein n=1 Tax=Ilyodon furcidens TaxID=33524 RepID=A0ABV0UA43_9TELE